MSKVKLPSEGRMVTNIAEVYARSTTEQQEAGRAWYTTARGIVYAIAIETESDPVRVCYALSALSPRNPWRWNVADVYSFAVARKAGLTMPTATTFIRNQLRAWKALGEEGQPWTGTAPKVRAFVDAIMGDSDAVVVDTWAYRVATGEAPAKGTRRLGSFKGSTYADIAAAYTRAASLAGETPRDIQAITWLVAQTEGLASARMGRHDLTFKAGTPDFVKELLS